MAALRPACIEDAAEIARLAGELGYPVEPAAMDARLRAILPLPQHRVTVAQGERGGLVGWIAVERRLTLESGERIEIVGLVVDAAARGTGIGRALVADAERWALAHLWWQEVRAWRSLQGDQTNEGSRPMRASGVLQKCLSDCLEAMHAAHSRVLLLAVEALLAGRRLTLMDVARSWPGAERVRAPLKALDRLLSNRHLHADPWLLLASPSLVLHARQLVTLYARRMQIELSFRDLKSHRYGQGFEDSLTRVGKRIEILLLVNALAAFASWLAGLACEATGVARWLLPTHTTRKLYSVLRTGREALVRHWPMERTTQWLARLQSLPESVLEQMSAPA